MINTVNKSVSIDLAFQILLFVLVVGFLNLLSIRKNNIMLVSGEKKKCRRTDREIGWNILVVIFAGSNLRKIELFWRSFISSLCITMSSRCWVSGGACLSQSLGHSILDQFNHIFNHKTHRWPETSRSFQPGSSNHNVWRWSSTRTSSRWMSKVCIISLLPDFGF